MNPIMRVRDIQFFSWDGIFPTEEEIEKESGREDRIFLANRDQIVGEVKYIGEKEVGVQTEEIPDVVDIPRDRISRITIGRERLGKAKKRTGDVRVLFKDGGSMTFKLETLTRNYIEGTSQNFHKCMLDFDAIKAIQFNIYSSHIPKWEVFH